MAKSRMRSSARIERRFPKPQSLAGIQIRVQDDPNDPFPHFIELETLGGKSICAGEWANDGASRLLQITPSDLGWVAESEAQARACEAERQGFGAALGMLHALGRVAIARQLDELYRVRHGGAPASGDVHSLEMARQLDEEADAAEAAMTGECPPPPTGHFVEERPSNGTWICKFVVEGAAKADEAEPELIKVVDRLAQALRECQARLSAIGADEAVKRA